MNQTNEPVAWKYRYTKDGDWQVSLRPTSDADIEWLRHTYKDFEIVELQAIEPNTITIPSAEYAKLKEDAERLTFVIDNLIIVRQHFSLWRAINLKTNSDYSYGHTKIEAIDQAIKDSK